MNHRIKKVRKALGLSGEAFGSRVGVSRSAISNIESGDRNASNQLIIGICREFSVNETWLRTGEGEMFLRKSTEEEIEAFVGGLLQGRSDSFKKRLIVALSKLDDDTWEEIEAFASSLVDEAASKSLSADPPADFPPSSVPTAEELHRELDRQLSLEKGGRGKSEVS